MFTIRDDDLTDPQTQALLALHLAGMQADSPPESVFALDLSGLRRPDIRLWSAWNEGAIACVGALRTLTPDHGEIKSMRTHPDYLRRGAGTAMLAHIIAQATQAGMAHLSLETGRGPAFAPAIALYRRHGFTDGEAFGDYVRSDFNQFLHLTL